MNPCLNFCFHSFVGLWICNICYRLILKFAMSPDYFPFVSSIQYLHVQCFFFFTEILVFTKIGFQYMGTVNSAFWSCSIAFPSFQHWNLFMLSLQLRSQPGPGYNWCPTQGAWYTHKSLLWCWRGYRGENICRSNVNINECYCCINLLTSIWDKQILLFPLMVLSKFDFNVSSLERWHT